MPVQAFDPQGGTTACWRSASINESSDLHGAPSIWISCAGSLPWSDTDRRHESHQGVGQLLGEAAAESLLLGRQAGIYEQASLKRCALEAEPS